MWDPQAALHPLSMLRSPTAITVPAATIARHLCFTSRSGVVHSEMPIESLQRNGGRMHGFQLWLNLPAAVSAILCKRDI